MPERSKKSRQILSAAIERAMSAFPDLRVGQLISNALSHARQKGTKEVKRYVFAGRCKDGHDIVLESDVAEGLEEGTLVRVHPDSEMDGCLKDRGDGSLYIQIPSYMSTDVALFYTEDEELAKAINNYVAELASEPPVSRI